MNQPNLITTRKSISLNMTLQDLFVLMAEGNPGALSVLIELGKNDESPLGVTSLILSLDDMNIRGWQIWVGYKDHCKEDIKAFTESIKSRSQAMVAAINHEQQRAKDPHMAVVGGGSFRNRI